MRRLFVLLACTVPLAAQAPRVVNAKFETRSAAAGLESTLTDLMASPAPLWIGYAVDGVPERQGTCDGEFSRSSGRVRLEPGGRLLVLLRATQGKLDKIRALPAECEIDAGGLPFYWLPDVKPAESVAMLARRATKDAVMALAFHAGAEADSALDTLASGGSGEVRERAIFWLGSARGARGFETLRRLARNDPAVSIRRRVMFALSRNREPAALDELIRSAREDAAAEVRKQALFWLAQKAGRRAVETILNAVENDPETEIKRHAVFALHQLPPDQGIPLLIRTARTHGNPEVRKRAFFWLGQSSDPRALRFFEEVLKP